MCTSGAAKDHQQELHLAISHLIGDKNIPRRNESREAGGNQSQVM